MEARYYSPALGRFLSRDPIGFDGGINPYAYCYGDPINYSDADGTLAGPPIYTELPYVSEIVGSGELGATGGAAAGGATIGAGGVVTLCAADFSVFYCAFHPLVSYQPFCAFFAQESCSITRWSFPPLTV